MTKTQSKRTRRVPIPTKSVKASTSRPIIDLETFMPAIDKAIYEGGGWANAKRLPGGEDAIWELIDRGILEEVDGYVRRASETTAPKTKYRLEDEIRELTQDPAYVPSRRIP